jgi:plasmid stabilization system protein ParE
MSSRNFGASMEYLVRMTERAAQDMEIIHGFIGAASSETASAWFHELPEAIYSLETYPERGIGVSAGKRRQLLFGSKPNIYRIIYAIDKKRGAVNVLHIRHGARV